MDRCVERSIGGGDKKKKAALKYMLKIVPQTTLSLSPGLENPGAQKHRNQPGYKRDLQQGCCGHPAEQIQPHTLFVHPRGQDTGLWCFN